MVDSDGYFGGYERYAEKSELKNILHVLGGEWYWRPCKNSKLGDGIEIDFTQMYDPPPLNFGMMKELSDYFGTNDIDFDNSISKDGCETCDYGSRYGYEIQIYNITKNDPRSAK